MHGHVTVACVLSGTGKYSIDHVHRLERQVEKYLPVPHTFVCLSPNPLDGVQWIEVPQLPGREGCWHKLELFRPGTVSGSCLYLDLDVTIVADLTPLLSQGELRIFKDPLRPGFNSSVMAWHPSPLTDLVCVTADRVKPYGKPLGDFRGDQDFLLEVFKDNWEPLPGVHSYKVQLNGKPKSDTIVAVFHGEPKPWSPSLADKDWVR